MSPLYDPDQHHRRSIRLRDYDYRWAGAYYVTIVTFRRECLFDNRILRRVVETGWLDIPKHFPNATLDEWIVMPDHIHGIIVLDGDMRKGEAFAKESDPNGETPLDREHGQSQEIVANASPLVGGRVLKPGSIGAIVGNFKTVTARRINAIRGTPGAAVWLRNYYEHVVRDEEDLERMREYIAGNPSRREEGE